VTVVSAEVPSGNVPTIVSVPVVDGVYTPAALTEPVLPDATVHVVSFWRTPFRLRTHWLACPTETEFGEQVAVRMVLSGLMLHAVSQEVAPGVEVGAHWPATQEK
jgi:hypothetical protein